MAKYNYIKNNFLGGEISPRSYGRSELDNYRNACAKIENGIVLPQGGIARRPGTEFITSQLLQITPSTSRFDLDMKCRIIPYIRSKTEHYLLIIRANTDASDYTTGTNCDMWVIATGSLGGIIAGKRVNESTTHSKVKMTDTEVNWIEVEVGATNTSAKQFKGYSEDQINDVKYTAFGDYIVLTHPEVPPMIVRYLGTISTIGRFVCYPLTVEPRIIPLGTSGAARVDDIVYSPGAIPYRDVNLYTSHTLTPSGTTGSITVTSSKAFFSPNHVGVYFQLTTVGGYFEVTAYTSSTSVTATVISTLGGTGATADWREGAWSDYRGFPRVAVFHQNRLWLMGNLSEPTKVWGSKIGNVHIFDNNAAGASDPVNVAILSDESNEINWAMSGKNLNIGTRGREYITFAPDATATISTGNIDFSAESANGSAYVNTLKVGNSMTFIDRDSRTVREFVFNFQEDSYRADAFSFQAEHMPFKSLSERATPAEPAITHMAYQGGQNSVIWFTDSNGGLFACTRVRELQISAWHSHRLGGNFAGEMPFVEDICSLPNRDGVHDDVYLLVKRTINGSTVRMIERISQQFRRDDLDYSQSSSSAEGVMSYCDASWTSHYAVESLSAATDVYHYFDHLEGQEVNIIGDGKYYGEVTVTAHSGTTGGTITFPEVVTRAIAGLPYTTTITTLQPEAGSVIGSGQSSVQSTDEVALRFNRTAAAKVGDTEDNVHEIVFRENSAVLSDYFPLFTGIKVEQIECMYSRENRITVVTDVPLPFELTSMASRGDTFD